MSENTTAPQQPEQPDEGTFLGGDFGTSDNAEDEHPTTAEQIEAEQDAAHLLDPTTAPAAAEEFVTETSGTESFDSDTEGTSTEPSPGERNEPV